jgi:hypothetical protein
MATITYCDLCEVASTNTIKIKVFIGTHPHNGDKLYEIQDACPACINERFEYLIPCKA